MKKEARLILGGGAAYGLAHIGAIEAIRAEFRISGIVGTSMGAIIGGLYALGKTPREILALALDSKSALVFNPGLVNYQPLKLSLDLIKSLHNKNKIMDVFAKLIGDARIEALDLPFVAVAYDLNLRQTILIDKGPLTGAMRASSSLPLLFSPHEMNGHLFVDGGIEHPLPVAFKDLVPGNFTIAVNVLPPVSREAVRIGKPAKEMDSDLRAHEVVIQSILQNQGFVAIQAMLQNPPDLFIDTHNPGKNMFDLADVEDFYDFGYQAAKESLARMAEPSFMNQLLNRYQGRISRFMKRSHSVPED
jgi:NTE family protein